MHGKYLSCPKKWGRYRNPHIRNTRRSLWDFLLWPLGHYDSTNFRPSAPLDFVYPNQSKTLKEDFPVVSWINHSTFHLCYEGIHILTDPIWTSRCSPFSFIGPKRLHEPAVSLNELPKIDVVLISHDHYDHLDALTMSHLLWHNPQIIVVVPEGVGAWFRKRGFSRIIEKSWWKSEELLLGDKVQLRLTSVPSQHFSGRGVFDKNKTLWCGWVFQFFREGKLHKQGYFVGDTGYNHHDFVAIGEKFQGFDLSLIPIGTYIPFTFMAPVHICPNKAALIHKEVKSKLSIGMHWKTFNLSDEALNQPPYDLYLAMKELDLDPLTFKVLNPGQWINW